MPHVGRMTADEREAYRVGRHLFASGDDETALGVLDGVLRTCPRFADVHYMVGLMHERQGRLDEAGASFERALAINPSYAECLLAMVSVSEQRGEFARSRELAARLQRLQHAGGPIDTITRGKLANLHAGLGDAYREAGELREAIDAYRKALDRAPRFHDIRQRLGICLREAGLPSQAIAEFRRVLRGNPAFLDASVQLGLTWFSLGRTDRAVQEWSAVLERDPSRDDARMYLRMVPKAGAPEAQG